MPRTSSKLKAVPDYHRLARESSRAYHAFIVYRDLGPTRSLAKLFLALKGRQAGGKRASVPGHLYRWCAKFNWIKRAAAWDDEVYRQHEKLIRHLATEAETHRLQSFFASFTKFDPIRDDLIKRCLEPKLAPIDRCRLLAALRQLEGNLQGGFAQRAYSSWY